MIYDEAVSGDFSDSSRSPVSLGTIGNGVILGSIDAGTRDVRGNDQHDNFSFTLTETTEFAISISNATNDFMFLYAFNNSGSSIGLFQTSTAPTSLDAGFYSFNFTPSGNVGTFDYTVQFGPVSAVPLPAGIALYAPFMLGAGVIAARRRRRAA